MPTTTTPTVLVVDDSTDDLLLAQLAGKEVSTHVEWRMVNSGVDALAYLAGEGIYANRKLYGLPRLMILDLSMPWVSGFEVLSILQKLARADQPAICVLSNSRLKLDEQRAAALGADVFHTKTDFDALCCLFEQLTSDFCSNRVSPAHAN